MSLRGTWRVLLAISVIALAITGGAAAQDDEGGINLEVDDSLVEVTVASKAAAMQLQLGADDFGVEFNDHYLRQNDDGTFTVTVFASQAELDDLAAAGYEIGTTLQGPSASFESLSEMNSARALEAKSGEAALGDPPVIADDDELVILRADYFENYAGRYLSVEAKDRLGAAAPSGSTYVGPAVSVSWNVGAGPIDQGPRPMNINIDPDTTPDTYIEHRILIRIGNIGEGPAAPTKIRIGSSTGASLEGNVSTWLGSGVPPAVPGYLSDFTTRYMDPTEVRARFFELADEYSNLAELVTLPYKTNGYQRKAQANMAGTTLPGSSVPTALQGGAVVLTSRAWGHEGGNLITAEFLNPGVPNAPLTVGMIGNDLSVSLATDATTGALSSTAAQVIAAINAHPGAAAKLVALTYRGNAGVGIVQARAKVTLSDFLNAPAHVQRGQFEISALRIGKRRDGKNTGVFLYCQQHAREWATPLTCLETAEQLLQNYALDPNIKRLVDNLEIFILPSSNPDGSHYSMYDFSQQRRNMTNHCVNGGKVTDDPNAASFWTPRINPSSGLPYTNTDPASRNAWGVDNNRNNTVGTLFDGYIGASHSCTSDTYTGPSEASEPEIKNELWIADTFTNIKFSNNIHSFGGYFMWAPGTYLPDRSEGVAVHANIGIEKYFFEAGDRILNRIKAVRGTVILPQRTGPIADVLYSAAGNSADEHWYNRGVIAYSFETGADRFGTTLSIDAPAGATQLRVGSRNNFVVGDIVKIDWGTANEEVRRVVAIENPTNPPSPAPNITLDAPLALPHTVGTWIAGGNVQNGVNFQPDYAREGKFEVLEFSAGNVGLLESAYEYHVDKQPPRVMMTNGGFNRGPVYTTFQYVNEPSVIRYTLDGTKPDLNSTLWDSSGTREPGQVFYVTSDTLFKWMATDIKGNVSYGAMEFIIR